MNSSSQIKKFILDNISSHQRDIIQTAIQRFGISRQAVLKHMHSLINEKHVIAHGRTRDRFYELRPQVNYNKTIQVDDSFSPQLTINNHVLPHLSLLPRNLIEIIQFSMSALFRNVADHSNASKLYFKLYHTHDDFHAIISDNGIGIFGHIRTILHLESIQNSAIELAKGRVTTDKENRSGEELYTVLHLFDSTKIESNGIFLNFYNKDSSFHSGSSSQRYGTRMHLKINPMSNRSCQKTFMKIFDPNKSSLFIPVNILKISENDQIDSRLQARSILRNIQGMKKINFDFNNINLIGPAFVDELVRNIRKVEQPIDIQWINSNEMIDMMMSNAIGRFS